MFDKRPTTDSDLMKNLFRECDINSMEESAELLRDINTILAALYRIGNVCGINGNECINSCGYFKKIVQDQNLDICGTIDKLEIIRTNLFGQIINWDTVQTIMEQHEFNSSVTLAKQIVEFYPEFDQHEKKAVQKWLRSKCSKYNVEEALAKRFEEANRTMDKFRVKSLSERTWEMAAKQVERVLPGDEVGGVGDVHAD